MLTLTVNTLNHDGLATLDEITCLNGRPVESLFIALLPC